MSNIEEITKLIGRITVSEMEDLPDGSCRVVFDYDEKFKQEYKRIFGLKRWSKRHFEKNLDKAIVNFAESVREQKALLDIKDDPPA